MGGWLTRFVLLQVIPMHAAVVAQLAHVVVVDAVLTAHCVEQIKCVLIALVSRRAIAFKYFYVVHQ